MTVSEKDFSRQVEDLLKIYHWQWIHIRPARVLRHGREIYETPYSGHKGFLDYLCLRPPRIVVFELKNEQAEMTTDQQEWFLLWEQCQRTIIIQPLKIKGNTVNMKFSGKTEILTLPEVYLWRPSDIEPNGGKILEILELGK